jgi:plasmid stabilization system protein ParE
MDGTYDITWDEHAIAQLKSIFDWYAKNVSKEQKRSGLKLPHRFKS